MYVQSIVRSIHNKLGSYCPALSVARNQELCFATGREIANIANRAIYIKQQIPS